MTPNPMVTDVDTCLKDIADFYIQNRRGMTDAELESILMKHCGTGIEVQKFAKFLDTEPGQMRFKTLLREKKMGGAEYTGVTARNPVEETHLRDIFNKVTVYELESTISHLPYEPEIKALPYEPYIYPIYSRDESKAKNVEYLTRWMKRYPEKKATELIMKRLEEKVAEKAAYPVTGVVPGTKYITWKDFTALPSYPIIARAVDYRHDYTKKCSPFTKDGYLSVDVIYNMSAWAGWKSSSLDPTEMNISQEIHKLPLYELMRLNKGRRSDQPALFPEKLLPLGG